MEKADQGTVNVMLATDQVKDIRPTLEMASLLSPVWFSSFTAEISFT